MLSESITSLISMVLTTLSAMGAASVATLAAVYTVAALISGFSGFGFSAIGALSFAVLPPTQAVPVLVYLSLLAQLSSVAKIWDEVRTAKPSPLHLTAGVWPSVMGSAIGLPMGVWLLTFASASSLMLAIGLLLPIYAAWAAFAKTRISPRYDHPVASCVVGVCGGVIGGVCGFPGSAMVVWNGLLNRGKEGRAYTQLFVLLSQVLAIAYFSASHRFPAQTWILILVFAPLALLFNTLGVNLYKSASAGKYRTITLAALAASGFGLVAQVLIVA